MKSRRPLRPIILLLVLLALLSSQTNLLAGGGANVVTRHRAALPQRRTTLSPAAKVALGVVAAPFMIVGAAFTLITLPYMIIGMASEGHAPCTPHGAQAGLNSTPLGR